MSSDLKKKVALVTGAGRGTGRTIAQALSERGAALAVNDITPINLDETVVNIRASGGQVRSYVSDIAKKMPVQGLVRSALEDFGRLDILVNCAEVKPRKTVLEMDDWDWQRTLDVNLTGA
ncbi:MAG: SDR family NAD(P)-dependent oxidoreductase, partial [Chloroflexi bacterium]|nr:SDR family NAD(P)-dependent oxidoreductase [Chloroflexota bacterium]